MNTLIGTEPHPAARGARDYILSLGFADLMSWREAFASCAIEGNRLAEVCGETLRRFLANEPVSDRYILGLAWTMRMDKEASDIVRDVAAGETAVTPEEKAFLSNAGSILPEPEPAPGES